jgi:hypothetical protein
MQKWEYLTTSHSGAQHDLDSYGENGWELVAVIQTDQMVYPTIYWKRPLAK